MLDACKYVVVRRYAPDGPYPALPVYAPAGAPDRLAAAYGEDGSVEDVYQFYALQPGTFPIGPFAVTVDRVNHPVETYGVRLEHGGRVLALLVGHRALRGAAAAGPERRPVPLRGELPRRRGQPAGPAPDRSGGRRGGDQGRRWAGCC